MSREPVGYTCPTIDKCKDKVEQLVQNVGCGTDFDECSVEELRELHKAWMDFDWVTFDQDMEEIRSANDELRRWGQAEEERVDELEDQVKDLEKELER